MYMYIYICMYIFILFSGHFQASAQPEAKEEAGAGSQAFGCDETEAAVE